MLYDNAQLASLYIDTYLKTKNKFYLTIAEDILSFIKREMFSDEGGFYSSLDADSEGEEGKYYTWSKEEVIKLLGEENGSIFCDYFDITEKGNFEGRNIPRIITDRLNLQKKFKKSPVELDLLLSEGKKVLMDARSKRVYPGLDDKIIVSWNGLMLSAFARAYQVTGNEEYAEIIQNNIVFLMNKLYQGNKLKHTYKSGQAKIDAFLDDYANLIQGLLDSYEALFNTDYLEWALKLTNHVNEQFWDNEGIGYYYTSSDQEALLIRLKDYHDQSIPSANGIMLMNLLRIFSYTGNNQFQKMAEQILFKLSNDFITNPYGYCSYLNALDFYLNKPKEIVILPVGEIKSNELNQKLINTYISNKIIIYLDKNVDETIFNEDNIKGKHSIDQKTTIYVCSDFTCSPPITSAEELANYLK